MDEHPSAPRHRDPVNRPAGAGETAIPVAVAVPSGRDAVRHDLVELLDHELRTPLTSVVGLVELLLDGEVGPLSEAQASMLRRVSVNSLRLSAAVEQVLDVCHHSTGAEEQGPDLAVVLEALGSWARGRGSVPGSTPPPPARRFVPMPARDASRGRPTLAG